jgi:hypothetical protein
MRFFMYIIMSYLQMNIIKVLIMRWYMVTI